MVSKKMIVETIKGLFKPATIEYPYKPSPPPEGFLGKPEFIEEKCIGCGACAKVCPSDTITIIDFENKRKLRYWYGKCAFCGRCYDVCPENAIELKPVYELATQDKDSVVFEIELDMLNCKLCGKPFVPTLQLKRGIERAERIIEKYGLSKKELEEIDSLCPSCKSKRKEIISLKRFMLKLNPSYGG
ncbi:MAG: 4Fe-4S dicluster domain-containing protein [Candidatus Bathyarchaeia archaeon]